MMAIEHATPPKQGVVLTKKFVTVNEINFGDKEEYPVNFYNGCGSYYIAVKDARIVASVFH